MAHCSSSCCEITFAKAAVREGLFRPKIRLGSSSANADPEHSMNRPSMKPMGESGSNLFSHFNHNLAKVSRPTQMFVGFACL